MSTTQSEYNSSEEEEAEIEGEDAGLVTKNPLGEFSGGRNDKNERHGRGRAALPNGDLYLGCYYRGQRHGLGIYRYKNGNGARYGGDWVLGVKQGWGSFYYPDGSQYTGHWDRNERHGWGVYVFPNGDEYEGWWYRGKRNGRGIYRTKKPKEKFVGSWILGKRQGPGMIIRDNHRFIGNFYNDVPKGNGVYIFPELQCEQHGKYTHLKLQPGPNEKWLLSGYQVRLIRSAQPPADPVLVERDFGADAIFVSAEMPGEGADRDVFENEEEGEGGYRGLLAPQPSVESLDTIYKPKEPEKCGPTFGRCDPAAPQVRFDKPLAGKGQDGQDEQKDGDHEKHSVMINPLASASEALYQYMKTVIGVELEADEVQIPIVPFWRVTKVTGLLTQWLDDTVPPPPLPPTPVPPIDAVALDTEGESEEGELGPCDADDIARARRLARTHTLQRAYLGQGVCQTSEVDIRYPEDEPYTRFSSISLTDMNPILDTLRAMGNQLGPLDQEAAVQEAEIIKKKLKMAAADRWRDNLGGYERCEPVPAVKPPAIVEPVEEVPPTEPKASALKKGIETEEEEEEEMTSLTDYEEEDMGELTIPDLEDEEAEGELPLQNRYY